MRYTLAVDIGNTNITLGTFRGAALIRKAKMPTSLKGAIAFSKDVGRVIISSVVPSALSHLVHTLRKIHGCEIVIVGKDVKVPIKNLYRKKSEVGQDRLINAFAAKSLYGVPAVVIDFGTAITFDVVSKKGEYLGGLILPGIELSLNALYQGTALLPKVELKPTEDVIGKDTASSMRGGMLFGFGAACDSLVSKYRKILGRNTKIIATGGDTSLMARYAKSIQIVDEDLTLKGLRLLIE